MTIHDYTDLYRDIHDYRMPMIVHNKVQYCWRPSSGSVLLSPSVVCFPDRAGPQGPQPRSQSLSRRIWTGTGAPQGVVLGRFQLDGLISRMLLYCKSLKIFCDWDLIFSVVHGWKWADWGHNYHLIRPWLFVSDWFFPSLTVWSHWFIAIS